MRRFEVVSKVFGAGVLTLQGDGFGWLFEGNFKGTGYVLSGTWRILSAVAGGLAQGTSWHGNGGSGRRLRI